ncbi:hypothetical protein K8R61_01580 [bacterium]|nr:hypothetical protein [bacterium]
MKIENLKNEITKRQGEKAKIRESINEYCKFYYGINNFCFIVDHLFKNQERFGVCLARQIPIANIEYIANYFFAIWLSNSGISTCPILLGLEKDSFSSKNSLKRSYCKLLIYNVKTKCLNNQWIIDKKERGSLDGKILSEIYTVSGETLSAYHQNLEEKIFGNSFLKIDFSRFFSDCLQKCLNNEAIMKPSHLFVEESQTERLIQTRDLSRQKILRPSADWYYLLYLLFFVDGSRALLSTVEDNGKIASLFKKTNDNIKEITGFSPLIIDIPKEIKTKKYQSNLLEIPEYVLTDKIDSWQETIKMPSKFYTFFEAYEFLEKQVLSL